MTSLKLPKGAFLPRFNGNEGEHATFVLHRNRLFERCSATEQLCLIRLAHWYGGLRLDLLAKPNIFSESSRACVMYRMFPWANTKPNLLFYALAKVQDVISRVDRKLGWRAQAGLVQRIRSLVRGDDIDTMAGIVTFVRALPLHFGLEGKNEFDAQLTALLVERIHNKKVPAVLRFEALARSVGRSYEDGGYGGDPLELRKHSWPILLDAAQENMKSALHLIDQHWNQTKPPELLMTLHLHERPELAYQLAVTIKPHHAGFAMGMLQALIPDASFQAPKLDKPAGEALQNITNESCRLLADWLFDDSRALPVDRLKSISCLLRWGSPQSEYWIKLFPESLKIIKAFSLDDQEKQVRLVAEVAFYCRDIQIVAEAQELFKSVLAHKLGKSDDWQWSLDSVVSDISFSLFVLEERKAYARNPFFKATPNHPLINMMETQLGIFLKNLQKKEPANALSQLTAVTLALHNEVLFRRYHDILRMEFEPIARDYPVDAGQAMMSLIKYCGIRRNDEEKYRTTLCQDSFNALLPQLELISPADAAVARSGIGWRAPSAYD